MWDNSSEISRIGEYVNPQTEALTYKFLSRIKNNKLVRYIIINTIWKSRKSLLQRNKITDNINTGITSRWIIDS